MFVTGMMMHVSVANALSIHDWHLLRVVFLFLCHVT